MGRIADLLSAVAAAADEGGEGLVLAPGDYALLSEGWSDDDIDDALSLVQDSLMLGELVEACDALGSRLMGVLGAFGDSPAFEQARREGARVPLEAMAHLARSLDRLQEILAVYRDEEEAERSGFAALRRRLAELGIEAEMAEDRSGDGEPEP